MLPRHNPFSTKCIRPGAIGFLFLNGERANDLIERLRDAAWRGQIIGDHGSGKSTLIAALADPLKRAGRRTWTIRLRDGQRGLPRGWASAAERAGANMIVIDGYEQLSRWSRWLIAVRCRRHDWAVLVTAHRDVGFPTIFCTRASVEVAQAVVARLVPSGDETISRQTVTERFLAADGDVREMLFALYDEYELRGTSAKR